MEILKLVFIFIGMLGLAVGVTVYVFYVFFVKNAPDAEEIELAEQIAVKNRRIAV